MSSNKSGCCFSLSWASFLPTKYIYSVQALKKLKNSEKSRFLFKNVLFTSVCVLSAPHPPQFTMREWNFPADWVGWQNFIMLVLFPFNTQKEDYRYHRKFPERRSIIHPTEFFSAFSMDWKVFCLYFPSSALRKSLVPLIARNFQQKECVLITWAGVLFPGWYLCFQV
jgi:hypothetical protein